MLTEDSFTVLAYKESSPEIKNNDVVLIMGGPMGVYEKKEYSFTEKEFDFIKNALIKM